MDGGEQVLDALSRRGGVVTMVAVGLDRYYWRDK
jgi:hypothetical protein